MNRAITNEQFLRTVYGADYARAWVTGFKTDPGKASRPEWSGAPYRGRGEHKIKNPWTKNTFTTISVFNETEDGKTYRRKALCDKTYLIMIDDVGTKVDAQDLISFYGLEPSYRLETSPGNEQWGLVLETGDARRWAVEQLQNGMVAQGLAVDGKDPGIKGVTRYCRLPEGINNKQKYVDQLGEPFRHRLIDWHPERKFTLEQIANLFGIALLEPAAVLERQAPDIEIGYDHVLDALAAEGLIKESVSGKPGAYDITCPWVHEHTDANDSGSVYFGLGYVNELGESYPGGGFKCHHGHCDTRKLHDLKLELRRRGHRDVIDDPFADLEQEPDADDPLAAWRVDRFVDHKPAPVRWLLDEVLPLQKVAILVSPGGTGKTYFSLDLAIAIATGGPVAGGLWQASAPGGVLALYAEEDRDELHRRLYNTVEAVATDLGREAPLDIQQVKNNLFIGSVTGKTNLLTAVVDNQVFLTKYVETLIETAKLIPDLKLIILDPVSRFRGGDENNNEYATRFIEALEHIAQATGAAVLMVHHTNKGAVRGTDNTQAVSRGASALTDGSRWQAQLRVMSVNDAEEYGIPVDERRSYVQVSVPKNNYAPPIEDRWLHRESNGILRAIELRSSAEDREAYNELVLSQAVEVLKHETEHAREYSLDKFSILFKDQLDVSRDRLREVLRLGLDLGRLALGKPAVAKKGLSEVLQIVAE
jgi:RecA-family ATPase